ncbi:LysR family transcriptional regulator [Solimicrobium silvestre]|uniref:LysR substrate binding domain n=1 Tax=Solimicrobium silvestre TaxID=2099400 RepID=A0A2S9GZL9_9BURK|nr:LysR family transcriptional regulator [Solimicrobium silvestre]PRC93171.1 LysR substrate binding domain [Solimicrobium silvestre]
MNLNQLRFAHAVATTGSFTAAAAECFVTQPTLSNGIAQFEEELGERLFVRTTRKVTLTAFGIHILPCIIDVLSAQATLVHQAQAFLQPEKRLIRIGTSPLINANLLGLMIEPFQRENPAVDVVLREMNMEDLYRMLDSDQLDFVFGITNTHKGSWDSTFLYQEPLLFIPRLAELHKSPHAQSVQFKDISDETYVMVPDGCGLSRATRALFRSHRRKLNEYAGQAMSYQVLEEWAMLGIGAAILPKSKVSDKTQHALPITDKAGVDVVLDFQAIWSRKGLQLPHLFAFSNHLSQVVPAVVAGLGLGMKNESQASYQSN